MKSKLNTNTYLQNKILYFVSFIIYLSSTLLFAQYTQDILGQGFESQAILLNDYEGKVQATLIRSLANDNTQTAILYVHGFNDYFFQKHLAKEINKAGFHFYAIDLRKYGRSHLPHQKWCNVREISEYYAELDSAINIMHEEGIKKIILNAHSTGGLIIANYLNDRKEDKRIVAALFNSPFLEFNDDWFVKKEIIPILALEGGKKPDKVFKVGSNQNYGMSLSKDSKGEWDYNLKWKKLQSPSVNNGWIRAIHLAQKRIKKESDIQIPIVIFTSDKSYKKSKWDDEIQVSDAVLNVKDIWKYGKKLGNQVSFEVIVNGKHDLSLSIESARKRYFEKLIYWIKKVEN